MSRFARFTLAVVAAAAFASQPGLCQVPSNFWFGTSSILRDSSGNFFAAGHTAGFLATRGAYQFHHTPAVCFPVYNDPHITAPCGTGFVAKFAPTGKMIWGTYLGAPVDEGDSVSDMALDSAGNVWVTGPAGANFPTTPNAFDATGPPSTPIPIGAFLAELSADGSQLLYSTFFHSGVAPFVAQDGALYFFGNGVTKLNPLTGAVLFTALPGISLTGNSPPILDANGAIYFAAATNNPDFPITEGVYSHPSGGYDVVLVGLDPDGNLIFSTKIGGSGDDVVTALARDAEGNLYLAGGANPGLYQGAGFASADFPLTRDAAQTAPSARGTAFIVKLSADASTLLYSSYLGAQFQEMKIGDDGKVSGLANNFEARTPDGYQPCSPSYLDYVRLTADLKAVEYSTGTPAAPFDFDTSGNVYIANYPVKSPYFKTLDVSAAPHSGPVCMAASASLYETTAAPGLLVSIFGPGVGPDQATPLALDASGRVATQLAGTEVLFDGIPAPILSAAPARVDVVVPFGVPASDSTTVSVLRNGKSVGTLTNPLAAQSLWLYTTNGTGTGVAAWNQDGTPNSAQNPAKVGDILTFYGSGAGPMTPTPIDGTIAQSPQSRLPGFTLGVGGFQCPVLYAGDAPGQVAGIVQINCEVTVSYHNGPVTFSTNGSYELPEYGAVNILQLPYQIYVAP